MSAESVASGAEDIENAIVDTEHDNAIKDAINATCSISETWDEMDAEERADSLEDLSNSLLESWHANKVDKIECSSDDPAFAVQPEKNPPFGYYNEAENKIVLNKALICQSDNFQEAIDTIFHESLHAFSSQFDDTIEDGTSISNSAYEGSVHERLAKDASDWTSYQLEECENRANNDFQSLESVSDKDLPDFPWIFGENSDTDVEEFGGKATGAIHETR